MAAHDEAAQLAAWRQKAKLQAKVCYMNVDRTLATWTRTALSLIIFGILVDRFGLLLTRDHMQHVGTRLAPNPVSSAGGIALVAIGIFIGLTAGIRHERYRKVWKREYGDDEPFGPWLAFPFTVLTTIFGIAILGVMLAYA